MSLVLVVLYESNWLREDGAKLFFFGACFVALLVLARYASNRSESSYTLPPANEEPPYSSQSPNHFDEHAEEVEVADTELDLDSLPPARSVSFTLSTVRFASFDIETGPPDPECFCDDVSITLNYRGGIMPWDFTVATPKGLEAKISGREWRSAFVRNRLMVVPFWDAAMITADLTRRIKKELEAVPEELAEDEMKEADRSS